MLERKPFVRQILLRGQSEYVFSFACIIKSLFSVGLEVVEELLMERAITCLEDQVYYTTMHIGLVDMKHFSLSLYPA